MGGETSKPVKRTEERHNDRLYTEMAVQQALEQQRKMYEKKCESLMEAQSKLLQQPNVNKSNTPTTTPSSNLYPNVRSMTPQPQIVTNINVRSSVHPSVNQPPVLQGQYQVKVTHVRVTSQNPSSSTSASTFPIENTGNTHVYRSQSPHPQPQTQPQPEPRPQPIVTNNNIQTSPNVNKPSPLIKFQFSPSAPSAPEAPADEFNENQIMPHRGARPKSSTRPQSKRNNETRLVNCVTCSKPLESYIYNCQKGHSSCPTCKKFQKPCGLCSTVILDMRNITLEKTIAENNMVSKNNNEARIKCSNVIHGCCLSFNKEALNTHLKECPFRDLKCPFSIKNNCNWKGKINHLSIHLKEAHPQNCEANVNTELTITNNPSDPYVNEIVHYVPIGPFNFLVHIKRDAQKTIYMTTQLYGTKVSASKWTYELHVYNKKTPRRKFQYSDTCHSDTTSVQDLFDAGQCAVLPIGYAKTFLDNNNLTYKFYLKKENDLKTNRSSQNTETTRQ